MRQPRVECQRDAPADGAPPQRLIVESGPKAMPKRVQRELRALTDSDNDHADVPPARSTRSQTRATRSMSNIAKAMCAAAAITNCRVSAHKAASRQFPAQLFHHMANAVLDKETGEMLEYRQLLRNPKYSKPWYHSSANEFGRLAQGIGGRVNGTNTLFFVHKHEVPADRFKDTTYGRFVCVERPQKEEVNRTRLTVGGNRINYPGEVGTPTADMLLVKVLLNSVISTPGAKFMTADISNFYLNTPLPRFEYMKLKLSDIPPEVIAEYKLEEKVAADGHVYVEIRRGMYGLPQAGLIAQELLEKRLNEEGSFQSKLLPGFWTHQWRPIQFTLVVDDFGVKYVGKEHADHLMDIIRKHYKMTEDWKGEKYIGLTLDWDYERREVHLSMPGYVAKGRKRFHHPMPRRRQDSPYPCTPPQIWSKGAVCRGPRQFPPTGRRREKNYSTSERNVFVFRTRSRSHRSRCPRLPGHTAIKTD